MQGEAETRLLVKSPALSEVGSEWAAMEAELAGAMWTHVMWTRILTIAYHC